MKPRTLGVLAAVVVVLGLFVWLIERDLPSSEERAERGKLVLPVERDEIVGLRLEWPDRPQAIVVEREVADEEDGDAAGFAAAANWRLVEPLAARADSAEVASLITSLVDLEKQRRIEEPDREGLGLASPRALVTLRFAGGEERVLTVGAEVPSSDSMVVAVDGDEAAYLAPSALFAQLDSDPDAWRDRSLFVGERAEIAGVRLAGPGGEVRLAEREGDFWVEPPAGGSADDGGWSAPDRADTDSVDGLLAALTGLQASRFLDPATADPEALGLAEPAGTIEVTFGAKPALEEAEGPAEGPAGSATEPFVIELGAPTAPGSLSRTLRAGDQLAETSTDLAQWLERRPESWRSRSLSRFESWGIDGLTLVDGAGELVLERSGADWLRDGDKIAYPPVGDLLSGLADTEVEGFAGPFAATEPPAELELTLSGDDAEPETLTVYPARSDGRVPVAVSGRPGLLLVDAATIDDLAVEIAAVREAEPLPEEDDELPPGIEVDEETGDGPLP